MRLICLLPARDAAEDLPRWFQSAARLCDAVVALDDGSVDGTGELLRANPLVVEVLENPRRESAAGWDDAANRTRLLRAAAKHDPDWILFLDADETLDAEDAEALRRFVDHDAVPGFVYGLQHFRMWEADQYDPECRNIYRLFAFEPGHTFPAERLHFHPVPEQLPRDRWLPTTVRVRHWGADSPEAVERRLAKYRAADPEGHWPVDQGKLDQIPSSPLPGWRPRHPDLPVLLPAYDTTPAPDDADLDLGLDAPTMSVVVIAQDDREVIEERVAAVLAQHCDEPFEVVVVVSGSPETAAVVRKRYPDVELIELADPVYPGAARNAAFARASGEFVVLADSHVELEPGCLEARRRAHLQGHAMVAGAMRNGTPTPAGWASYFLDHSGAVPGRPSGRMAGPPGSCSYERAVFDEVGAFPEDMRAGEDTAVNVELFRRGHSAWFEASAVQVHYSHCTTPRRLFAHHLTRGRALARLAVREGRGGVRQARKGSAPLRRYSLIRRRVRTWGDLSLRRQLRASAALVVLGAVAYRLGFLLELLRPRSLAALALPHGATIAVAGLDRRPGVDEGRTDAFLLVRVPFGSRSLRALSVPRDLLLDLPGHGLQRINEAYIRGGPRLVRAAVRNVLGVELDGMVAVDFQAFVRLVDELGGLDVVVPRPFDDPLGDEDLGLTSARFEPGPQRLSGAEALAYARSRRLDGDSARRQRHLELLRAALVRVRAIAARSPLELLRLARTARQIVRTDIGPVKGLVLGAFLLGVDPEQVRSDTIDQPLVTPGRMEDGRWIVEGDPVQLAAYTRVSLGLPGG